MAIHNRYTLLLHTCVKQTAVIQALKVTRLSTTALITMVTKGK